VNGWKSVDDEHSSLGDILLNLQLGIIEPLWKSITTNDRRDWKMVTGADIATYSVSI
jgi:hypothetical protein